MSDYYYSSARVRALENGLLGREALQSLAEAPSVESLFSRLAEHGWEIADGAQASPDRREQILLQRQRQAFGEIAELTDGTDTTVFALWRYPYDCNNLKAAIKCFFRHTDPASMSFDFGTIPLEAVWRAVETNDFSALPTEFAEAAREAVDGYAKNKNPQALDALLDRACYRAMLSAAEASGVSYAERLVRAKIDLVNLIMCVRVMRMQMGEGGRSLLAESLLEGGKIARNEVMELYDGGEDAFWERLLYTDYRQFAENVAAKRPSLSEVERKADDFFLSLAREARFVSCGPEVLIGYLLGVETDTRNLRIIMAGKAADLPAERIMERIRESYV